MIARSFRNLRGLPLTPECVHHGLVYRYGALGFKILGPSGLAAGFAAGLGLGFRTGRRLSQRKARRR